MDDRTLVTFSDNPVNLLNAYADSGEGIDRAGGFAVQVGQADGDCVWPMTENGPGSWGHAGP
jgi:septum formation protein